MVDATQGKGAAVDAAGGATALGALASVALVPVALVDAATSIGEAAGGGFIAAVLLAAVFWDDAEQAQQSTSK